MSGESMNGVSITSIVRDGLGINYRGNHKAAGFCHLFFLIVFLLVCLNSPINAGVLPDTGQSVCSNGAGTSIECQAPGGALAQDGSYSINPPAYIDNNDGTVTDNVTGLVWQKQDDGMKYNWYVASGTYHATYNPTSRNLCGELGAGWRLSSKKELESILDYGKALPVLPVDQVFTNVQPTDYWTASPAIGNTGFAWEVNFYNGGILSSNMPSSHYVRCVKGTQMQFNDFADNGDGTVSDNATGLMWQQSEPGMKTWEQALSYCESLELPVGGYTDWRLPNIREIFSITDEMRYNPAIDKTYFPYYPAGSNIAYWSSTTDLSATGYAWIVYFLGGTAIKTNKPSTNYFRCVRSTNDETMQYLLSLRSDGSGTGSVTVDTGSIEWSGCRGTASYPSGTIVTLTALPDPGSVFEGWTGDPDCADGQVTMNSDISCSAIFGVRDLASPETIIGTGPASVTNAVSAAFSFSSDDPDAAFECMLDSGAWFSCPSPQEFSGLSEGVHSFSVRATDASGNTDATPAEYIWSIDITYPELGRVTPTPIATEHSRPQTFTSLYDAREGYENLRTMDMLVNATLSIANGIRVRYDQSTGLLTMFNNAGAAAVGSCSPGEEGTTLTNDQGTLNCQQTSVSSAGSRVTIKWNITPKESFAGVKKIFTRASDLASNTTLWVKKAIWKIIPFNSRPTLGTVTPSASSSCPGHSAIFSGIYGDDDGHENLKTVEMLVSDAAAGLANSIRTRFDPATNRLYLYNDSGTGLVEGGGCAPGASGRVIHNSKGILNCQDTVIERSGNRLTVHWNITPKAISASEAATEIKLKATDNSSATTGFVKKGSWTVTE